MNHRTPGDIFQEINDEFASMEPASLDQLEERVLAAMHNWDTQIRHETCPECGTKVGHKRKYRQIATWVSDVNYKRWRRYCSRCKECEYD